MLTKKMIKPSSGEATLPPTPNLGAPKWSILPKRFHMLPKIFLYLLDQRIRN